MKKKAHNRFVYTHFNNTSENITTISEITFRTQT